MEGGMRILISGGSGLIGSALSKSLLMDGHQVRVLTRTPQAARLPEGAEAIEWDGRTSAGWGELVNQTDAVVNLVGERLSKFPWTKKNKSLFWNSRVEGGLALAEAILAAKTPPKVLIQASGVNYYGAREMVMVKEGEGPGNDFLAELCRAWEASTDQVEKIGVRRVIIRSAIVISAEDGILPIVMLPIKLFAGGPLGSGRQGLAWIHLEDEVGAIRFLLENPSASGAYNLTAPVPISSSEFTRVLARVLHRPYWLPVPPFMLRLLLGEMSTLVLDGAYILPERLQELGFIFRFRTAEAALGDLLTG
jgi:uncharacterized protein